MATSLRDIPGAKRARQHRKAERLLRAPTRTTTLDLTPGGLKLNRSSRRLTNRPPRQIDVFLIILVLGAVAVAAWIFMAFWGATRVRVEAAGIDDGRALTPEVAEELDI